MATDHAVILAAGMGTRLGAPEGHKILAKLGGRPLLDYHLDNFARIGVREVRIVTGHQHEELERRLVQWAKPTGMAVMAMHNPEFELSNGVSILAAQPQWPFWLVMADHVFQPSLFDVVEVMEHNAGRDGHEVVLGVDYKLDSIFDMPDANKVRLDADGRLAAIGKELEDFECVDVGLFWCGPGFVRALEQERAHRGDCNTSDAMRRLRQSDACGVWDVGDALWQDVDTPGARRHAEELIARWK